MSEQRRRRRAGNAAGARRYLRESALLIARGLRTVTRVPERLSGVILQPIIFTLLFLYVFGSAIHIPGLRYQDYLLPGMIAQSIAFGVIGSGVATSTDFSSGVVDRFRSLPITHGPRGACAISGRHVRILPSGGSAHNLVS